MLKKLLANVGEYKKQSLQTPLFTMGEVLMDVIMPLIMAGLIDNGIEKSDTNAILRYGGLLFLCALFALAMGTLGGRTAAIASAGFAKNLRHNYSFDDGYNKCSERVSNGDSNISSFAADLDFFFSNDVSY